MGPMDPIDAFWSWEFGVATMFVACVIQGIKMIFAAASPASLGKPWFRVFCILMNPAWGLTTALPAGHLKGESFGQRAMVGVVAGFVSGLLYDLIMKRLLDKAGINTKAPEAVPSSERKTPPSRPTVVPPPPPEQGP